MFLIFLGLIAVASTILFAAGYIDDRLKEIRIQLKKINEKLTPASFDCANDLECPRCRGNLYNEGEVWGCPECGATYKDISPPESEEIHLRKL